MFCVNCGVALSNESKFCAACGTPCAPVQNAYAARWGVQKVGFSEKINDPLIAKYLKNSNRWALIFSFGLAIIAIAGFTIYGEVSSEMQNPGAFLIGLAVGSMFVSIALVSVSRKKMSKTFDGFVVNKKVVRKKGKEYDSQDIGRTYYYNEFVVEIRADDGKIHRIKSNEDDRFEYFNIGDRVRHHGGLRAYEKYDKTNDSIIFCVACGKKWDISEDYCDFCKCPLLK